MAPLAAIVAITAPEIFLAHGHLIETLARRAPALGGGGDRRLCLAAGRARTAARGAGGVPAAAARLGLVTAQSGVTSTLRNLIVPRPHCSANGPLASLLSSTSTVFTPFSTRVRRLPGAVIS